MKSRVITSLKACAIVLGKVAETGVLKIMRSLRIVTAIVTHITGAGLQAIVIALTIGALAVSEDVLRIIPIWVAVPIRIAIAESWTKESASASTESTTMETAAMKTRLRICVSRRDRGQTKHQQRCQYQPS